MKKIDSPRSGVTVLCVCLALVLGPQAPLAAPSEVFHLDAHGGHAPMPTSFFVQGGKSDPTGQEGSGGRAVTHLAGGKEISGSAARRAPDARLYRTGYGAWEPTLGVTKQGTVLFDGFNDNGDPAVIASKNEGASWDVVFDAHGITADPYFYVDYETSRIFANDYVPPCHLVSYSDDEGEAWSRVPPVGCGHNADHQTIFAGRAPKGTQDPSGYKNVVYICSIGMGISIASTGSVCSKSLDGGETFVPTGTPAFTDDPRESGDYGVPGLCNGANAHGSVGPDGTVYLPRGWCGQPWVAISHDQGLTWERVQVSDLGMPCCAEDQGNFDLTNGIYSHEAGVVADEKGNVYYVWVAADRLPYLVISRDGGETWGKPMMIGPPGLREGLLPGLTMGADGKLAVFYMGSENSPWDPEKKKAQGDWDKERWNAYVTMTANALDAKPVFYSATLNDPADPMHIGACGPDPIRCGWGDFLDVVVSQKGEPWAVAVDLCKGKKCEGGGEALIGDEAVIGRLVGGPSLR